MEANRFGLKLSLITLETATRPATCRSPPTRNRRTLQLADRVQRETNALCNLQVASNAKQTRPATWLQDGGFRYRMVCSLVLRPIPPKITWNVVLSKPQSGTASNMITGDVKTQIDRIWDAFWSGGISNPLEVI